MKRFIMTCIAVAVTVGSSAAQNVGGKITVAAAANISAPAQELKKSFIEMYPNVSLDFVFGASGALTTQIMNGAPFDLFMSADTSFPTKLYKDGMTTGPGKVYAQGSLVLLSSTPRDFSAGLSILAEPSTERFAMANPETAPYGKAAMETLIASNLWEKVRTKAVTAQSITQALQYTMTAAGLGFVNKSALYTKDLLALADKEGTNWIPVDPSLHAPIEQAYVVLKRAADNSAALAFSRFLSSEKAAAVFRNFGYAVPK